eukprot:TRINITY_DN15031_c0_g1_i1.p1 TRINITY_DN15031_c0_g1~~TRINITY_DN15031_c0_g1_i1.p1  ORF type:complete len:298 (-),score=49.70 TRINITY_DN15031_c0_g1_i1:25-918(-)
MRNVHIIDAMPYIFRAYCALPKELADPTGRPTNALFGFAKFLRRYLAEEKPTHVALCFDQSLQTCFRNNIHAGYKSNRTKKNPGLREQSARCLEMAEMLGLRCFASTKYEADDLIATLAVPLAKDGVDCVVVSNDKDMYQLVGPHVTVYDFSNKERLDCAGVTRKLGVLPTQVPDYLGLTGDSVDCIPGVPGIGPKTATALLAKFDNIDDIYANLHDIESLKLRSPASVRKKLEAGRGLALLSRRLATLVKDVPLQVTGLDCLRRREQACNLEDALREYGFGDLIGHLRLLDIGGGP